MAKHDVGNGVKAELMRLPGKREASWAAALFVKGRHVATVADPEDSSRDGALWEAKMWAIKYKDTLYKSSSGKED